MLAAWKALVYEPAAHKFSLYEKAPFTRGSAMLVRPNTISLRYIARNDRDGSLVVAAKGDPAAAAGPVPGADSMTSSAPWLDVAHFEFQSAPGEFEIIEARVFAHSSRTLLSQLDPVFGWQAVAPNRLQVYGLGKRLPERVDVWLRVHSYRPDDNVHALAPQAGAEVMLPGGVITISAIQEGYAGWSSASGFMPVERVNRSETAAEIRWKGSWQNQHYQVAAVSIHGDKQFHDRYLNLSASGARREMLLFNFPLSEIDHIELRPDGGRQRFFFEAVELPQISGGSFDPSPVVKFPLAGPGSLLLSEFAPLQVRIAADSGKHIIGSQANDTRSTLTQGTEVLDADSSFTLSYSVQGVAGLPLSFRLQDAQSGVFGQGPDFRSRSHYRAWSSNTRVGAHSFDTPIEEVSAIEVTVPAMP